MLRKAVKQFQLGVKNPQQALRVLASEAKMRAGIRTLRSIELAVTWICNLDCVFCYAEDLMKAQKRPPDMTVETVGKLTRDAHELGLIHVNVTGVDPSDVKLKWLNSLLDGQGDEDDPREFTE